MPKGKLVNQALENLRRYQAGNTVQPGMFSTLDELIMEAPQDMSADEWLKYLKPGRMLKREGAQFPLKKEELQWASEFGLGDIATGKHKLTKDQLREMIKRDRQGFGVTMGRERFDEAGKLANIPGLKDPFPADWMLGKTDLEMDINVEAPKYGADYAGDTDSRLFHQSPSSMYEESVTRMPGLDESSHFSQDTLSWSRTSSHNTGEYPIENFELNTMTPGNRRVRLIEEIQSDLHSRAAQKIYTNPDNGKTYPQHVYDRLGDEEKAMLVGKRRGHVDEEAKMDWEDLIADMDELRGRMDDLGSPANNPVRHDAMQMELDKFELEDKKFLQMPQDAPYKNPRDYAGLEIRKQLLNAVDNDEDYLAIVRGIDQIERYSQGMDGRRADGMRYMYDDVYKSELEKLGKRYGAKLVDVEIPLTTSTDVRPASLVEMEMENTDELFEMVMENIEQSSIGANAIDEVDEILDVLREMDAKMEGNVGYIDAEGNDRAFKDLIVRGETVQENIKTLWDSVMADDDVAIDQWNDSIMGELNNMRKKTSELYEGHNLFLTGTEGGGNARVKDFPALELTPEVKAKIKKLGVPQYAKGGPVRMQSGGLSVFETLRRPDAEVSEEDYELVMANLSEREDERVLQEKMGTGEYWWDTIKHLPAMFLARMKKVNPETGEIRWLGRAEPMDLDMVGRGIITMDQWKEQRDAAAEYNAASKDFNSVWVDDVKAMGALPPLVGNLAGEYLGIGSGSISDPEAAFQYPEWAVEAAGRVGEAERATQEDFGLEDPTGFPQHLTGALGAMMTQIPVPGAQLKGAVKPVTSAVASRIPQAVKTATAVPRKALGAASEFANPFIDPSVKNYLTGATFGGVLGDVLEPSGADIRFIEQKEQEYEVMADKIDAAAEQWDEIPMETRVSIMYSPFAMQALQQLTQEQRIEMLDVLDEMGAFDDAE